jgi:hypothetical protein
MAVIADPVDAFETPEQRKAREDAEAAAAAAKEAARRSRNSSGTFNRLFGAGPNQQASRQMGWLGGQQRQAPLQMPWIYGGRGAGYDPLDQLLQMLGFK